jgi:hypothetical protein
MRLERSRGKRFDRVTVRDIRGDHQRSATSFGNERCGSLKTCDTNIGDHDIGAGLGESDGGLTPDAPGSAGDHGGAPGQRELLDEFRSQHRALVSGIGGNAISHVGRSESVVVSVARMNAAISSTAATASGNAG